VPPAKSPAARAARVPARAKSPSNTRLPALGQLIPSGRSILVGLVLVVLAAGAYAAALETSIFAVRTLDVRGGTPQLRAEVRQALEGELGRSLLRVDEADVEQRLASLPGISALKYNRAFPNTLDITVRAERPVLVLRRGPDAFLVSATGRVLRTLAHPHLSSLPRVWLPSHTQVTVNAKLPADAGGGAAVALAALRGLKLPAPVRMVSVGTGGLTLVLSSGFQVRLGDAGDIRLKLAIARRVLRAAGVGATTVGYLDVSVPERAVLNLNSQVTG
jgi:cell division protein FtsQ